MSRSSFHLYLLLYISLQGVYFDVASVPIVAWHYLPAQPMYGKSPCRLRSCDDRGHLATNFSLLSYPVGTWLQLCIFITDLIKGPQASHPFHHKCSGDATKLSKSVAYVCFTKNALKLAGGYGLNSFKNSTKAFLNTNKNYLIYSSANFSHHAVAVCNLNGHGNQIFTLIFL